MFQSGNWVFMSAADIIVCLLLAFISSLLCSFSASRIVMSESTRKLVPGGPEPFDKLWLRLEKSPRGIDHGLSVS